MKTDQAVTRMNPGRSTLAFKDGPERVADSVISGRLPEDFPLKSRWSASLNLLMNGPETINERIRYRVSAIYENSFVNSLDIAYGVE